MRSEILHDAMSIAAAESQPKRSRTSFMLMFFLFVGVGGAAVWANLWKEDLRVLDVQVKGNGIVSAKEIVSLAGVAKGEKLFGVDLFAAQERIMKNQFLRSASVNRRQEATNNKYLCVNIHSGLEFNAPSPNIRMHV